MTDARPYLGLAAYFDTSLVEDAEARARVAGLLVDQRWPWLPSLGRFGLAGLHQMRASEKKQKERASAFRSKTGATEAIISGLANRAYSSIRLSVSRTDDTNHADCEIDTGTERWSSWEVHHGAEIRILGFDLPRGKSIAAWITLMHELVDALRVKHAILCAFADRDATLSDVSLMGVTVNDVTRHPFDDQRRRAARVQGHLGGKYVRHPRWGTYLLPRHLDAVGGIERVRREVEPHEVRAVGELTYIQLTPFEDALTDACEAKRQALERILDPILVPPLPAD